MKKTVRRSVIPSLLSAVLVALILSQHFGGWNWLSSDSRNSVGAVLLGLAYFAVLMVVVLERSRPGRQGRHRRDLPVGAR